MQWYLPGQQVVSHCLEGHRGVRINFVFHCQGDETWSVTEELCQGTKESLQTQPVRNDA